MKNQILRFIALLVIASSASFAKPNIAHLSNPKPNHSCVLIYWTNPSTFQGSFIRNDPFNAVVYGWNTANGVCATWYDWSFSTDGAVFSGERAYVTACQNVNYPMNCPTQFQSLQVINTQVGYADWKTEVKLKGTEASFNGYVQSNCEWYCSEGIELTVVVEKECSQF